MGTCIILEDHGARAMGGSMQAVLGADYQLCGCKRRPSRIGVVLLEHDPDMKRKLEMMIEDDPSYVIVASTDLWVQCERLLEEHVPELLIAGAGQLPPALNFEPSEFPLVMRLRAANHADQAVRERYFQEVRGELLQLRHEVYLKKARQLSVLLECYFAGLNSVSYISALRACQSGESVEIAVAEIRTIEASGNYVRIYTSGKMCTLRDTISRLQAKLDPAIFVRVHRSHIVNLSHVSHMSLLDSAASLLLLNNGQTIPIGPNYRAELVHIFECASKLIA